MKKKAVCSSLRKKVMCCPSYGQQHVVSSLSQIVAMNVINQDLNGGINHLWKINTLILFERFTAWKFKVNFGNFGIFRVRRFHICFLLNPKNSSCLKYIYLLNFSWISFGIYQRKYFFCDFNHKLLNVNKAHTLSLEMRYHNT